MKSSISRVVYPSPRPHKCTKSVVSRPILPRFWFSNHQGASFKLGLVPKSRDTRKMALHCFCCNLFVSGLPVSEHLIRRLLEQCYNSVPDDNFWNRPPADFGFARWGVYSVLIYITRVRHTKSASNLNLAFKKKIRHFVSILTEIWRFPWTKKRFFRYNLRTAAPMTLILSLPCSWGDSTPE